MKEWCTSYFFFLCMKNNRGLGGGLHSMKNMPHFHPDFVNWATMLIPSLTEDCSGVILRRKSTWFLVLCRNYNHSIFLLPCPQVWWDKRDGEGRGGKGQTPHRRPFHPNQGDRRRAGAQGRLWGCWDLIRCHIWRFQSQNEASCPSNSISIQGDKLLCCLTNSVHFLSNQCSGNNMRTANTNQWTERANQSPDLLQNLQLGKRWRLRLGTGRRIHMTPAGLKTSNET